jgi:hypothetical protein
MMDWIILGIGCIALLAGIILIAGLLRMIFKAGGAKKTTARTRRPARPERLRTEPDTDLIPSVNTNEADNNKDELDELRKRVSDDIRRLQRFDSSQPPGLRQQPPSTGDKETGQSLREQVLAAARNGMDLQQIARQFHIGADQIALIIRVAAKDKQ